MGMAEPSEAERCRTCGAPAPHVLSQCIATLRAENARLREERDEYRLQNSVPGILDEVESPSPIPVGAPGSNYRRAWELGRRLKRAEAK